MQNKLENLNNHLFAQLERLSDEDISSEDLAKEIDRADAIKEISKEVVSNAKLVFAAHRFGKEFGFNNSDEIPEMFRSESMKDITPKVARLK